MKRIKKTDKESPTKFKEKINYEDQQQDEESIDENILLDIDNDDPYDES